MPSGWWTQERDDRLRILWETEPDREVLLQAFPGRTWQALCGRATVLRVQRLPNGPGLPKVSCPLTPVQAAYVAAFIDGEGYFQIKPARPSNRFHAKIAATNSCVEALTFIQQVTGCGKIYRVHCLVNRTVYQWATSRLGNVLAVTRAILPYLIVKRPHAELVLQWIALRCSMPVYRAGKDRPDELALYHQLRALNYRPLGPRSTKKQSAA